MQAKRGPLRNKAMMRQLDELRGKLVGVETCAKTLGLTVYQTRAYLKTKDEAYLQLQRWADEGLSTFQVAERLGHPNTTQVAAFLGHASPALRKQFELQSKPERTDRKTTKSREDRAAAREAAPEKAAPASIGRPPKPVQDEMHMLVTRMVPQYQDDPSLQRQSRRPLY